MYQAALAIGDRLDEFTVLPLSKDQGRGWTAPSTGGAALHLDFGDQKPTSSNAGDRLYEGFATASVQIEVPFNQGQGAALQYAEAVVALFRDRLVTRDGVTGSLELHSERPEIYGRTAAGMFRVDQHLTFHNTSYH